MPVRTIEIRAAEGGDDSKIFVGDLARSYQRLADGKAWKHRVVRERRASLGFHEIAIEITGNGLDVLSNESGGHRIQRVPPTERKGRVHTSTVTVAVMGGDAPTDPRYAMRSRENFRIEWFSGSGAGGQHRNKHQNCCRIFHIPTGIKQEAHGRNRIDNEREAMRAIIETLNGAAERQRLGIEAADRKEQVGSGMRGDKIRTVRFQDDIAKDHRTGRSTSARAYLAGGMAALWS